MSHAHPLNFMNYAKQSSTQIESTTGTSITNGKNNFEVAAKGIKIDNFLVTNPPKLQGSKKSP